MDNIIGLFGATKISVATSRAATSWAWYVIRASGFVGVILLILLMISGIGMVTGLTYKFLQPLKAWAVHKALGIALCVAIVIHVGFLLIDHFVNFSFLQITVPFVSNYTNGSKFLGVGLSAVAMALGVLAMYGTAVIVLSSLKWIDTKKRAWRYLHYVSYFVMFAAFIHALGTGTDLKHGFLRILFIAASFLVILGVISRLRRSGSLKKSSTVE
jgi:methionine sulfoxide reductase heme-binding subunit